jgi:hypothetical protein
MKVYTDTLPAATSDVLDTLMKVEMLGGFYLSAGTALALQLGHRESEDLDFFTQQFFDPQVLLSALKEAGTLTDVRLDEGTLHARMNTVKLQFLHYPYPLLEKTHLWNGIQLSSVLDIACTKLITISMRGSKKDFVDMYVILRMTSLEKLLENLDEKYRDVQYNKPHILKSLVYFVDADMQPMPRMHTSLDWSAVKTYLIEQVKKITF